MSENSEKGDEINKAAEMLAQILTIAIDGTDRTKHKKKMESKNDDPIE